ncbi:MAG: peptidase M64 [Ignavibacteriae bacterium]|nr:peptidase M64 [Ignavibacteriota bacterium]
MRISLKYILPILFLSISNIAQTNFDEHFLNKTLRLDYFHSGNHEDDYFTFDELIEEPIWAGSRTKLVDDLGFGNLQVKVFDAKTNELIYSRGYSVLFHEWQTTDEAKKISRTFSETVVLPFPKDSIRIEVFDRDDKNNFKKRYEVSVHPKNYFIKKENRNKYNKFMVHYVGDPNEKLDVVFLPEGYTKEEMDKFKKDCEKFSNYLFTYSPFDTLYNKINIWGVEAPSKESGTDIPGESIWKSTMLNTSFYTFDSERYLMTTDYKKVRDLAANAPYDQIFILVNSEKYGGGAIYNYYNVSVVDNVNSKQVFVHEFGHGLAGLADEYYTSEVSYQDFYSLDVEPWEANITTLIDFESKWKAQVKSTTQIPTPIEDAPKDLIGAYEGGGYVEKGVYRSTENSLMKSLEVDEFNQVSKEAIERVIKFYSE